MAEQFEIGNPTANLNGVYAIYAKRVVEEIEAITQTFLITQKKDAKRNTRNPNIGVGSLRSFVGNDGLEQSFKLGNKNNIYTHNGTKTQYGSNVVYAAIHEFGGKAGRNLASNIPARPYFRPAIAEWKKDFQLMFMIDFSNAVAKELGIELQ